MASVASSAEARPQRASPSAAFALLGVVQVLLIAAITVVAVPLPAIQRDLGLSQAQLALVAAGYGLSFSGLLLLGGRLADLAGQRRTFLVGVIVFGLASALGALASGFASLLAARLGQGCGAALAAPAAMALVGSLFPERRSRTRALAIWGVLSGVGATVGTVLSGVVITWVSWRWALAAPAAAMALAGIAAPWLLPAGRRPVRLSLDVPGALLATAGLAGLSVGLATVADGSGWSASALVPLAVSAVLLAAWVAVESRAADPLVPLSFLASPHRAAGLLAILLTSAGAASSTFFLSLYFQQIRGYSPLAASAAFLPAGLVALGGPVAGRLIARTGAAVAAVPGLVVAGLGLLLLGQLDPDSFYVGPPLAGLLMFAAGASLAFSGATLMAVEGVPDDRAGLAGGLVNTAMETGPTVGLAVLVSLAGAWAAALSRAGLAPDEATAGGYAFALRAAGVAFVLVAALVAAISWRRRLPVAGSRVSLATRFPRRTRQVSGGGL